MLEAFPSSALVAETELEEERTIRSHELKAFQEELAYLDKWLLDLSDKILEETPFSNDVG